MSRVEQADAVIYPCAMVVMFSDAHLAYVTVLRASGFHELACTALIRGEKINEVEGIEDHGGAVIGWCYYPWVGGSGSVESGVW